MPSSPSSTAATNGSANNAPGPNNGTNAARSATQQAESSTRIESYLIDHTTSHVKHRHASARQGIRVHKNTMKSYLDDFDQTMAR